MTELLRELCSVCGIAGADEDIRAFITAKAEEAGAEVKTDALGNVLAFKKGRQQRKAPAVLIAHMDEAGFKVNKINEDGTASVSRVGDTDPVCWLGQRVVIGKKHIPGAFCIPGLKRRESDTYIPEAADLLLDAGPVSAAGAGKFMAVDDGVFLAGSFRNMPNGLIRGRAFDSRIGCAVLLSLMEEEPEYDTWFAFTCRDSIKFRGSGRGTEVVLRGLEPAFAAFVESREAFDFEEVPENRRNLTLGKGCGVILAESRSAYSRPLRQYLLQKAGEEGIPYQMGTRQDREAPVSVQSNAAGGTSCICLAAPVRYLKSAAPVAQETDLAALKDMCGLFIRETEAFNG
ncbi:MAG: hypothetical protein IJ930_01845 [Lachnospiraceae bacterium]|nr:hypothetical protein [Lachnospiraceae bacterium]